MAIVIGKTFCQTIGLTCWIVHLCWTVTRHERLPSSTVDFRLAIYSFYVALVICGDFVVMIWLIMMLLLSVFVW